MKKVKEMRTVRNNTAPDKIIRNIVSLLQKKNRKKGKDQALKGKLKELTDIENFTR